VHNPFTPHWLTRQMPVTLLLLTILGGIFLKGFREAIGIAVVLVATYLTLNAVVTVWAVVEIFRHPGLIKNWENALIAQHPNWMATVGVCLLLFPRLALGLSGFETGVALMPLIKGETPEVRIRNTQKLLQAA